MADACLSAIGVATTAGAVAGLYADFLDGWLIDSGDTARLERAVLRRRPLLMTDQDAAAQIAGAALDLALELR
jgi:LPPG:FO 2-phospho-L-lactate transferase